MSTLTIEVHCPRCGADVVTLNSNRVGKITGNHFCSGCWMAWPCDQSVAIAALADQDGES